MCDNCLLIGVSCFAGGLLLALLIVSFGRGFDPLTPKPVNDEQAP